jgi:hypothetical protein
MSPGIANERPRHNPYQLHCPFARCRRWFRNQSGLTKHLRAHHSGQATLSQRSRRSPPANADEAQNLLPNDRGSQDFTPPLAGPPSPSFSQELNQTTFDTPSAGSFIQLPPQDGSFSLADTFHDSPRESSPKVSTPEGDEPILKMFHPIINGFYTF